MMFFAAVAPLVVGAAYFLYALILAGKGNYAKATFWMALACYFLIAASGLFIRDDIRRITEYQIKDEMK